MMVNGTLARTALAVGGMAAAGGTVASYVHMMGDRDRSTPEIATAAAFGAAAIIGVTALSIHNGNGIAEAAMQGVVIGSLGGAFTAAIGYSLGGLFD